MIRQGHVKTVTVGGRPNNQPMAVIGGVQGASVLHIETLRESAKAALGIQSTITGNTSAQTDHVRQVLKPLTSPPPLSYYPVASAMGVNFMDNIAENDTSVTPLQFSGGIAADCRFYYMPKDMVSVANTWTRVAQGVKANGKGLCINGTMKNTVTTSTAGIQNGSGPLTFQGSASVTGPMKAGWVMLAMIVGVFIMF